MVRVQRDGHKLVQPQMFNDGRRVGLLFDFLLRAAPRHQHRHCRPGVRTRCGPWRDRGASRGLARQRRSGSAGNAVGGGEPSIPGRAGDDFRHRHAAVCRRRRRGPAQGGVEYGLGRRDIQQQRHFAIDPHLRHLARRRAVARIFAVGVADLHGGACGYRQICRALFAGSGVANHRIDRFLWFRGNSVCDDVQMAARHAGRLARRLARRRTNRGAVRNRKIPDRLLCWETGTGIGLWRGYVARHASDLGLLFRSNRSVRRRVHSRLRQAARASGRGASRTRQGVSPAMALPLRPPFGSMEALSVDQIPVGKHWQYEPKWDGFRCIVFRDGKKVELQSKSGRMMTRYFPELVAEIGALKPKQFVLDGEIVVPAGGAFSFDALLQRIHPAASRVKRLSVETPAMLIVFDLLVGADGRSLTGEILDDRRPVLESFFRRYCRGKRRIRLSPMTTKPAEAKAWLGRSGKMLDGIIAKRRDLTYRSGDRTGMQKIKNYRSADCVVGGFRTNANSPLVGSLLLGLYDRNCLLHHVGFSSSIKREDKPALTKKLKALIAPPGFTGNAPGGPSRWSTERSGEWQPLKPKLVVEVCYDHFSGERFRHGTRLLCWRPDKSPRQCTLDQVKQKKANLLALLG